MSHEQLTILLKNTPASRVEKAEIMYSTPPQYHVRGAAINLLLKGYRPEAVSYTHLFNAFHTHFSTMRFSHAKNIIQTQSEA